jgi:AcrR family transcriptional regulator
MPSQPERRQTATAALLRAATALIIEGGFANAAVVDIGALAGMSRGAVNFYFGSKSALLATLVQTKADEWAADITTIPADSRSWLDELDLRWDAWTSDPLNPRTLISFIYEALGPSPEVAPLIVELRASFMAYIEGRIAVHQEARSAPADMDGHAFSVLLTSSLLGLIAQSAADETFDLSSGYLEIRDNLEMRWPATG